LDHLARPRVRAKKNARDRLIRLAQRHPDWVLGYQDETWWSRLAQPSLRAWTAAAPFHLVEQSATKSDPDPKALACYGLLRDDTNGMLLRFVEGRPVSQVTEDFLDWVCQRLAADGKKALLLIWDNAPWHVSQRVRAWIGEQNRQAKEHGGVRILPCFLPSKSPWLNAIEPKWVHGKKAIAEPERTLTAQETKERIYAYYGTKPVKPLKQKVA
jgi:transposase